MDYSGSSWEGHLMAMRSDQFYPQHVRRVRLLILLLAVMTSAGLYFVLDQLNINLLAGLTFIVMPFFILFITSAFLIIHYAMEPLDILSRAVTKVSGEANDVVPPDINHKRFEKNGLKSMVQIIYSRSFKDDTKNIDQTANSNALAILNHLPCGVIALDGDQQIVFANELAPILTNEKGEKQIELMFNEDDLLSNWLENNEHNKVTDEHMWTRVQNRLPGSEDRKLFDVVGHYQKGQPDGVETILVVVDRTTHYSKDEEDMDFIALAAHELRGPITVIRGYLDVLTDEMQGKLEGDQGQLLERLSVSASRLSGYVNNILNVSRYDRRHLKLHLREDRLSDVYSTIADDLQLRARTQNRLLAVNLPADLPTIAADRNSLSEVLANLADNAIKYSREGGQVVMTARVDGDFVICEVEDKGMGIPGSLIGNLFTKFYRSHRSRQYVSGTGLGLYICKAIVESHGGQIGVRSKEGEGSTFYFSVPIYSTVADKLLASDNGNEGIIESSSGWIKNHSLYRG